MLVASLHFFPFQNNKNTFPPKLFPIKQHSTKTWHRTGFLFVFLFLLVEYEIHLHQPYRCLMWRWRKLIIFDSVNCANSAVTQVRKWAVDTCVQNNNIKTIVNAQIRASFDSSWSLAHVTSSDVPIVSSEQEKASVRPSVACNIHPLDITPNNQKPAPHTFRVCGFVLVKTHTETGTRVIQRSAAVCVWRSGWAEAVCVRSDQLDRAMVSITCSSLDLSLCLRDCSSRSSADRICAQPNEHTIDHQFYHFKTN